jgi:hypothetical protein
MLGIGAGRFVVGPSTATVTGELQGSLTALLEKPIAAARGALSALAQPAKVARILLDSDMLETYLHATPEPTRSLVVQIAQGAAPKELLISGDAPASLIDDVLADLCARGAIVGVADEQGHDLLGPEIDIAMATLRAAPPRPPARTPSRPPSRPPMRTPLPLKSPPQPPVALGPNVPPSSLADAVMREISERTGSAPPASVKGPIIEPDELKPRSNPPQEETMPFELMREEDKPRYSNPLIEIKAEEDADIAFFEELERLGEESPAQAAVEEAPDAIAEEAQVAEQTDLEAEVSEKTDIEAEVASDQTDVETIYEAEPITATPPTSEAEPDAEIVPPPPAKEEAKPAAKPPSTGLGFLLLAVLAFGGVFARLALTQNQPATDFDPPAGAALAPNEGRVEISGGAVDVSIDGVVRGHGPHLLLAVPAGPHEVRAGQIAKPVDVVAGRLKKIDVSSP